MSSEGEKSIECSAEINPYWSLCDFCQTPLFTDCLIEVNWSLDWDRCCPCKKIESNGSRITASGQEDLFEIQSQCQDSNGEFLLKVLGVNHPILDFCLTSSFWMVLWSSCHRHRERLQYMFLFLPFFRDSGSDKRSLCVSTAKNNDHPLFPEGRVQWR